MNYILVHNDGECPWFKMRLDQWEPHTYLRDSCFISQYVNLNLDRKAAVMKKNIWVGQYQIVMILIEF